MEYLFGSCNRSSTEAIDPGTRKCILKSLVSFFYVYIGIRAMFFKMWILLDLIYYILLVLNLPFKVFVIDNCVQ